MSSDIRRWVIWKHDCIKHGAGYGLPCEPPCTDPWQVNEQPGFDGGAFRTWAEAIEWAESKRKGLEV